MGAVAINKASKEVVNISEDAVIVEPKPFDPAAVPVGTSASSNYAIELGYEADKATDGNLNTRWNAGMGGGNQWLMVKYDEMKTFDQVKVFEAVAAELHRITKHQIKYYNYETNDWETVSDGTTVTDSGAVHDFPAVTSDLVRLYVNKITGDSVSITELEVYHDGQKLETPVPHTARERGYYASSEFEYP